MKRMVRQFGASALVFTIAGVAHAQDPAAAPAAEPAPAPAPAPAAAEAEAGGSASLGGSASATGGGGMTLPGAAPAAATAGDSDHDRMIGRMAIGYLGWRTVLVGDVGLGGAVDAPVIGVRYWLDQMLGIDAGLGFSYVGTSNDPAGPGPAIEPSALGFVLHGGVPLSLASSGHFSFQIIPELNVGFASSSLDAATGNLSGSGFHIDVGARAGAEIHFGFIGIPELALQGSVGLALMSDSSSFETEGVADSQVTNSRFSIATSVYDTPWGIFSSNVAALYYF